LRTLVFYVCKNFAYAFILQDFSVGVFYFSLVTQAGNAVRGVKLGNDYTTNEIDKALARNTDKFNAMRNKPIPSL